MTLFAVATKAGLFLVRGGEAEAMRAYRFTLSADENASLGTPRILVRRNRIAAVLPRHSLGGGGSLLEVVIADSSGRVEYSETIPYGHPSPQFELFGNDRGLFVLSTLYERDRIHRIIQSGQTREIGGAFMLAADPGPDGWVLVDDTEEPSGVGYDWFYLFGRQRTPSCFRQRPTYSPHEVLSPGIVYVVPESSELVYERGSDRCRVRLPELPPPGYETLGTNRQGWVHLAWRDAGLNVLTANVATGQVLPGYALNPPSGHMLPNEDAWNLYPRKGLVDFAGATLTSLSRTDELDRTQYQLYRTFDGFGWQPIGNELLLYQGMEENRTIDEATGTFLLGAYWQTGTGGRYMTHAARLGSGVVSDVHAPYGTVVVSEDGRCLGTIAQGGTVEVVDMETGETHRGPVLDVDDARNAAYGFVALEE